LTGRHNAAASVHRARSVAVAATTPGRPHRTPRTLSPDLAGRRDRRRPQESGGTYGAMRITAELHHRRGISVGHNAVGDIMRGLGLKGCRGAGWRAARSSRGSCRWTSWTQVPSRIARTSCGDRHHRAPDPRGQGPTAALCSTPSAQGRGWSIDSTQTSGLVSTRSGWRPNGALIAMAWQHSDRGVQLRLGLQPHASSGRHLAVDGSRRLGL